MNDQSSGFSKHIKPLLKPSAFILLYLSIYLAAQTIITLIVALPILIFKMIENPELLKNAEAFGALINDKILGLAIPCMLVSIFICLPVYFLISKIRKQDFFQYCKFTKTGSVIVGLSLVLGISMNIFITFALNYINNFIPLDEISGSYQELSEIIMSGNTVLIFITVGIMGPLIEEVFFRGLVYSELRKVLNAPAVIVIQAFLFAVYHMNLVQGLYAFVIGVVLGIVVYKTGSIWPAIVIHVSFNSINVIIGKALPKSLEPFFEKYHIVMFAISVLLAASALMLIWFSSRRNSACIEENNP
ncbi:MAG: CPBP family intramembrane metalloprotease [Bacteroidales bacterium]|nr:CPBP family intramembrane metalloprotease [Bacteroidales bacterium]